MIKSEAVCLDNRKGTVLMNTEMSSQGYGDSTMSE